MTVTAVNAGFGDLLRYWRRVRGKTQLDLAIDAMTTPRYVSFVETGRSQPSRRMVVRLARALDVPLRERNGLLLAAGYAPLYPTGALDAPELDRVRAALTSMLAQHEPFPAVVMDRGWNVVQANDGAGRLFGGLSAPDPLPEPANVLELMVGPGPVREAVLNWGAVVRGTAGAVSARGRRGRPGSRDRGADRAAADDVRTWRPCSTTPSPRRSTVPVLDVRFAFEARELSFFSVVSTIGTPIDVTAQELRLEAFFASDEATRAAWRPASRGRRDRRRWIACVGKLTTWARLRPPMEIVAHHRSLRPAHRAAVTDALRAAVASGAERIEIDVLACGAHLAVAHDMRAARGADTLTVDEAFSLLAGGAGVNVLADLKHPAAASGLGAALAAHALGPRTIVCGELRAALAAARAGGAVAAWTLPAGRRFPPRTGRDHPDARPGPWGLATARARGRVARAAAWAVADGGCAAVCVDRRFVDAGLVSAVHAGAGRLYAWTADDERELRRLADLGVDGLITNDPAAAWRARAATLRAS